MMRSVEREGTELGRVVAELARATGRALDPATILDRAVAALDPVVPIGGAGLWVDEGRERLLVASCGATPEVDAAHDGAAVIALEGLDHTIGQLVVVPQAGATFDLTDHAVLEIAGTQIAGAIERARLFQEVMQLERLKSDFIARVSHELRTPITIINGFLDTMLAHDEVLVADQRRHMLLRSQHASSRLARLIEELLILSRIDAGVLTPDPGPLALDELLASVRAAATEPGQVLLASPPGAMATTDGSLLGRALGLVVDNAIKYGGAAEVTASPTADGWAFDVRDRGAGFAPEVLVTAFEMFTRGVDTTAIPGLGVGLPIARTLVEVLDGAIAVVEVPDGPGALVRITIPSP